jgi:tripartite-type tricarboxylate transporter receptor subunit TctC
MKCKVLCGLVIALLIGAGGSASAAENYPSKTIRFIVPFAVGGGANMIARLIAEKVSENVGQAIVVDNRPGAGGVVGTNMAVNAVPDGYTIALGLPATITVAPALFEKLPYNPLTDLLPIGLAGTSGYILTVHPSLPAKSVKELIQVAKDRPGDINYSSSGAGAGNHLAAELFKSMTDTNIVHIPYKGGGAALVALLSGETQVIFGSMLSVIPHIKTGRLRALAATGSSRATAMPHLPTIAEAGVPGYEVEVWFGVFAPKGTPPEIITFLNQEMVKVMHDKATVERFSKQGFDARPTTPREFAKLLESEAVKWEKVVRESGARVH